MRLPKFALLDNIPVFKVRPIICFEHPFCIGYPFHIHTSDQKKIDEQLERIANGEPIAKVDGYNIFINCCAQLRPMNLEPLEMKSLMKEMAEFYLHYQVETHEHSNRFYRHDYVKTRSNTEES